MGSFYGNGFVPVSKLEEMKTNLQRANDEVNALTRREHEWRTSIPVHEKTDSDVIIGSALWDLRDVLHGYEVLSRDMLKALKLLDAEGVWTGADDLLHDRIQQLVNERDGYKKLYEECQNETTRLHNKYAHEGGVPQVMTKYTLLTWLAALNIPRVVDATAPMIPNVFYVTFANKLTGSEEQQIGALGIALTHVDGTHVRGHYMLKWNPPRNDES